MAASDWVICSYCCSLRRRERNKPEKKNPSGGAQGWLMCAGSSLEPNFKLQTCRTRQSRHHMCLNNKSSPIKSRSHQNHRACSSTAINETYPSSAPLDYFGALCAWPSPFSPPRTSQCFNINARERKGYFNIQHLPFYAQIYAATVCNIRIVQNAEREFGGFRSD